jgi:hypothetical protein
MALTAAAAAAAAEWSAQFLWIWFAEMRFVASHHVSLVKLAEHVTLLKAAAATPRRAKFPSPGIRSGGRENYSPPSTRIWVTFIHETFVDSLQRTWALFSFTFTLICHRFCAFCEGSLHVSRYGYTAEGPAGLFCKVQLFI